MENSFTLLVVIQQNLLTPNTRELATDKVSNHLVLGLLDGVLVVLGSGSENTLLDEVDSWDGLAGGSCDGREWKRMYLPRGREGGREVWGISNNGSGWERSCGEAGCGLPGLSQGSPDEDQSASGEGNESSEG
jgi:hypothetical protein